MLILKSSKNIIKSLIMVFDKSKYKVPNLEIVKIVQLIGAQ
jgi:hypothetical protein